MSKSQINLPKTAFSMKANLPTREPEILELWKDINLYNELRKSRKGEEKFVLHDGPPYANGNIHMGTALNKTRNMAQRWLCGLARGGVLEDRVLSATLIAPMFLGEA